MSDPQNRTDVGIGATPPPNTDVVVDPGASDLFGSSGRDPEEDEFEGVPEDLKDLFERYDLSSKGYEVSLIFFPEDSGESIVMEGMSRRYPTIEYVGRKYGPGKYELRVQWRQYEDGSRVRKNQRIDYTVPEVFRDIHEEYLLDQKIKRNKKARDKLRNAKIDQSMEMPLDMLDGGEKVDQIKTGQEYVQNIVQASSLLGLNRQREGINWKELTPLFLTAAPLILKALMDGAASRRQEQQNMMQMMLTISSGNNTQLVEVMKSVQGPRNGSDLMEEVTKTFISALDIKERFMDIGKESLSDKLFKVVESIAPMIATMAFLPKQQQDAMQQRASTYVQGNPDFQALDDDPQALVDLVSRLDNKFGWKQADKILSAVEKKRPPECPYDPAKEYPEGSPERLDAEERQRMGAATVEAEAEVSTEGAPEKTQEQTA